MAITSDQLQKIKKIIKDHSDVLMRIMVGGTSTASDKALLKKLNVSDEVTDLIRYAFKFGKLNALKNRTLRTISSRDIDAMLNSLKLTPSQEKAVDYLHMKCKVNVDNLQQRLVSSVANVALEDKLDLYTAIGQVIPKALQAKNQKQRLARQLREFTQDWKRDWDRVVMSETWDANMFGEAKAILDRQSPLSSEGANTLVFKRPNPDACPHCKRLYLQKDGVTPRVFKLSDLLANGTNYGLKVQDWKPVVGIVHPNCQCTFNVMPKGYKFNPQGQLIPKS